MGLAVGFFVSLLTQRSELDFLLILFILFELANSVRNSQDQTYIFFFLKDALCPAVSEAKQVIGYAQRQPKFLEQWLQSLKKLIVSSLMKFQWGIQQTTELSCHSFCLSLSSWCTLLSPPSLFRGQQKHFRVQLNRMEAILPCNSFGMCPISRYQWQLKRNFLGW